MRCLFCDKSINKVSLSSIFLKEDLLCIECRNKLKIKKRYINIENIKVEYFYDYNSLFKDILLQYKECYDEALAQVFLYKLSDYINIKYYGYKLILVPSSKTKLAQRGFNHLELICRDLKLERCNSIVMLEDMCQENKNLNERKKMMSNYLYIGDKIDKALIFDDVLTSGSSLKGVYNAIKPYCNKLKAMSLAK